MSIAEKIAAAVAARGHAPLQRPFTNAECAAISEHGREAVNVELRRIEETLRDSGLYRSGFTLGLYPQDDPFAASEREEVK